MTTVLTLALDSASQTRFEELRQQHYPPERNRISAHISLFHQLPAGRAIADTLQGAAARVPGFPVQIIGVRSLGRGVAYRLAAPELMRLHSELSRQFEPHLIPQDRQRFEPHVVVQNKATPAQARELLDRLQASFVPGAAEATGLLWWEYLGGPWRLLERFAFATAPE